MRCHFSCPGPSPNLGNTLLFQSLHPRPQYSKRWCRIILFHLPLVCLGLSLRVLFHLFTHSKKVFKPMGQVLCKAVEGAVVTRHEQHPAQ